MIGLLALVPAAENLQQANAQGQTQNQLEARIGVGWSDVTPVARYRNRGDWLVDIGEANPQDVYGPFRSREYQQDDTERFFALDFDQSKGPRTLTATLYLVTEHAYWWFEEGIDVDQAKLEAAGKRFESEIYPLNANLFGEPWTPGIDDDPRIFILHQKSIGGYAVGVFSTRDECPRRLCPTSNQREMIYVGVDHAPVGAQQHLSVISHELQHLIQYNNDGNEQRWLDEGLAQLAEHLNGFNPRFIASSNLRNFLSKPNLQLNSWPERQDIDPAIHYAVGYIFSVYLYQRFGTDFIKYLARSPHKGLAAIEESLKAKKTGTTLDQVFADWTVTNYVNSPYVADGQFYYQSLKLPQRADTTDIQPNETHEGSLHEYAADYLQLRRAGNYTLNFEGDQTVGLTDAQPTSGNRMWWGYNEERGAARLEREFDLTDAKDPKLTFNAWWDLPSRASAAMILISEDGGKSWRAVEASNTESCRQADNNPCYTGNVKAWKKETVDLSSYAGKKIRVRFEYLTDRASRGQGFFVDDIAISAIGYKDDVESEKGGWTRDGFVRVSSDVPQHWAVNVVIRETPPRVLPVKINGENLGSLSLTVPSEGAVIIVAAMAPFVEAEATYTLTVDRN
jgi:hypothetical protein